MKLITLLSITFLLAFSSCHKSDRDWDTETQSTSDLALAESSWNDIYAQLDAVSATLADVNRVTSSYSPLACATISVNPALPNPAFPKIVTIDFGTTNCTGPDGKNRRGIITAVFSGRYRDSLTVITITPSNYYVNDNLVQGTKTITNNGHINGVMTFSIDVQNGSITRPDGKRITWNSQRTRRWIIGESTIGVVSDDVYEISGSGNGTGIKGNSFYMLITTPLVVQMSCNYITKGVIKLTPANLSDRIIDFGSGACDDQATITINGNTYNFTLQ